MKNLIKMLAVGAIISSIFSMVGDFNAVQFMIHLSVTLGANALLWSILYNGRD